MAIELAALNIPIRATGRDEVVRAFAEIETAGKKAAQTTEAASTKVTRGIMQQEAQAKANAQAYRQVERQARQTFERISLDVSRATADYRLGLISLKDYQQALAFAKQEVIGLRAETGALDTRRLAQFDKVLNQISNSARSARREGRGLASDFSTVGTVLTQRASTAQAGVRRVTSGISQMAVMAIGAKSALGSLAVGGLMAFGASAGLTLAVVAGTALIALGYDKITKSSREAKDELKKLREELNKPTPQEAASKASDLIREALAKAERQLAAARAGTVDPFAAEGGNVTPVVDAGRVAKAQAAVDALRKDLEKAQARSQELTREVSDTEVAALTKSIELRTANRVQVQQALALMPQLLAASEDETATLAQQNERREQYNALVSAFKKLADEETEKRKALIDGMRDEAALLVETGKERSLTTAEVDRLRSVYTSLTAVMAQKNLTDREQLELLKAQRQALAELAAQTSATFTTKGSTFGQSFGRPKMPGLDSMTFGADGDQTSDFFAGGALGTFGKDMQGAADRAADSVGDALASASDKIEARIDEMRDRLATGLAEGLADGIASGFEVGIATGSLGEGAKALTASLLSALGSAAISFGVGALAIAIKMELIKKSLMSLNPLTAIPAAIALIAIGGALKGVASRMFNPGGSASVSGGSSGSQDTTTRVIVGRDGTPRREGVTVPTTAASQAASVGPRPNFTYSPTIIGKDDQRAQRELVEMLQLAEGRGWRVRRG